LSDSESRDIVRRWNREIEAETRRRDAAERREREGPWKAVGWAALWLAWLILLAMLLFHLKALY
jgi:hypothetical protein